MITYHFLFQARVYLLLLLFWVADAYHVSFRFPTSLTSPTPYVSNVDRVKVSLFLFWKHITYLSTSLTTEELWQQFETVNGVSLCWGRQWSLFLLAFGFILGYFFSFSLIFRNFGLWCTLLCLIWVLRWDFFYYIKLVHSIVFSLFQYLKYEYMKRI